MKFCLIGSTRFMENYVRANRELTLKGHVVYTVAVMSTAALSGEMGHIPTEEEKIILDLVHLRKIEESEATILITDETGYYGFSTKREMVWGVMLSKPLFVFVTRDPDDPVIVHIGSNFGLRTIDDLPKPETIAEIIFETRKGAPMSTGFPMRGGEA